MLKFKKILKRTIISLAVLIVLFFIALTIYASNPYQPLPDMQTNIDELNTDDIDTVEKYDYISFTVSDPLGNILFIPGGLVNPHSYDYLAINLALEGYNVTVYKPFYDLAILTPKWASKFLDSDLENIVIGHSLGGVVASMIASNNDLVSEVILMGSYPIKDISDKDVLIITAEHDIQMDQETFDNSLQYVNDQYILYDILGGNHAQFGWYGPQKGDGEADISTLEQQNLVLQKIIEFLNNAI